MNNKRKEELKNAIRMCKIKAETLKPRLNGEKPLLNASYNRMLIEKAVLKDELTQKKQSIFSAILKRICNPKKEYICDYFKKPY